jgi:hypothetical protein
MLSDRLKSRSLLTAAFLALLTMTGLAPGDLYTETVYVPTSSVYTVPTSSVLATSYVVPSSYSTTLLPTVYTSSLLPTSYVSSYIPTSTVLATDSILVPTTTAYYRPSIFRSRRYVERTSYSYLPTSTILPTSYTSILPTTYVRSSIVSPTTFLYDDAVVTTSMATDPCDTTPSVAPTRAMSKPQSTSNGNSNGPVVVSQPTNTGPTNERKPTASLNSTPSDSGMNSDVVPPVPGPSTVSPPVPKEAPKGTDPSATAPLKEAPIIGEGAPPKPPATGGTGGNDTLVVPPAGQLGNPGSSPNDITFRENRKPIYDTRNILRGKVISAESKQPVEGVGLVLSSVTKQFTDRSAMTDAFGEFKVSLPDGDWTVKVKMPSGSIYTVGRDYVTASNGKITDASGRNVAEFLITR